ncbi:DUF3016 domain-containing protein [Pseudoduganella sp. OTU4001]|uniref:DUF3016 domain-containing protein n=1 Tax=Pseudoduganella sp. OTU4001 TaxID=3043854 RepID=UPI00313C7502
MNKLIYVAAAAAMLVAADAATAAPATVNFVAVDKMSDVPHSLRDREDMEFLFREHLSKLAGKLPDGQVLKVDFLDIDLAGEEFPRVAIRDVRVMKGQADWPRLHFRYSIEQDGRVISSGERKLANMAYLMTRNRYERDMYGHEKQMLDDWFNKDILHRR